VLEDDRGVLDLLCLILSGQGYLVLPAGTAEEAFRHAAQYEAIDLLIADIVLTASSWIRVALQLKRCIPHLKILLVSGYPEHAWREQDCAELRELPPDAVAILQKPFRPDMLVQRVGTLIGKPTEEHSHQ
jgi:CheY-like chemotaxis protein